MCRICGRVVKCIFDSMPSRAHSVPSRRAFSTIRRATTFSSTRPTMQKKALNSICSSASACSSSQLIRGFSGLSLQASSRSRTTRSNPSSLLMSSTTLRPSTQITTGPGSTSPLATISSSRLFSTTSALMGKQRRMDTFSPSRRIQKRRHGYLSRIRTKSGQATLKRRALQGRKYLSW